MNDSGASGINPSLVHQFLVTACCPSEPVAYVPHNSMAAQMKSREVCQKRNEKGIVVRRNWPKAQLPNHVAVLPHGLMINF
jgi:hypothetical protein